MTIPPPLPHSHVHSSILPCIALDTFSGLIVAANGAAAQLLANDDLPGKDFASFLVGRLPELIVFTEKVDHYKTSWTRDLPVISSAGREIDTEIHGSTVSHGGATYLVMQIIDMAAYDTRSHRSRQRICTTRA